MKKIGSNDEGGSDHDTHHLVSLRNIPGGVQALREELLFHSDVVAYSSEGSTFEDCLGRIAVCLDIALDGLYDANKLCSMLTNALRARRAGTLDAFKQAEGMKRAELVEREGTVSLEEEAGAWDMKGKKVVEKPVKQKKTYLRPGTSKTKARKRITKNPGCY